MDQTGNKDGEEMASPTGVFFPWKQTPDDQQAALHLNIT